MRRSRVKSEGDLIAVYSPVHRIGKTQFAIKLGKELAEREPVLYLNLEEYSGGGFYFPEQHKQNLGDLLYYLRQEKRNLGMRISMMAGQYENLDYIMPIPCVQDLKSIREEEWISLCDQQIAFKIDLIMFFGLCYSNAGGFFRIKNIVSYRIMRAVMQMQ